MTPLTRIDLSMLWDSQKLPAALSAITGVVNVPERPLLSLGPMTTVRDGVGQQQGGEALESLDLEAICWIHTPCPRPFVRRSLTSTNAVEISLPVQQA